MDTQTTSIETKHSYTTTMLNGVEVKVTAGWINTFKCFYLDIEETHGNRVPVYESCFDLYGEYRQQNSFQYYERILDKYGITLPDEMLEAIKKDRPKGKFYYYENCEPFEYE